jgi:hypothetical protein
MPSVIEKEVFMDRRAIPNRIPIGLHPCSVTMEVDIK